MPTPRQGFLSFGENCTRRQSAPFGAPRGGRKRRLFSSQSPAQSPSQMPQILKASPLASSLARADTALATFSVDYLPSFSRTILTSSTVLGKLQSADGPVPLARGPHPAVGLSPGTLPTPAPVRVHFKPGPAINDDKEDHDELPRCSSSTASKARRVQPLCGGSAAAAQCRSKGLRRRALNHRRAALRPRPARGAPLRRAFTADISGDAQWRSAARLLAAVAPAAVERRGPRRATFTR